MSAAEEKPSVTEEEGVTAVVLHPMIKAILTDVRWLLVAVGGLCVTIFLAGASAQAQIRTEARDAGSEHAIVIAAELERVKVAQATTNANTAEALRIQGTEIAELKKSGEQQRIVNFETNLNVRLLLQSKGIVPITVDPTSMPDAGGR